MKIASRAYLVLFYSICCLFPISSAYPQEVTEQQINAVLFYKPDCSECNTLRREFLPALKKQFDRDLNILVLNTADAEGGQLYLNALIKLKIPYSQPLPTIIIGNQYWSGLNKIKRQLPDAILSANKKHQTHWPDLPGLKQLLNRIDKVPESERDQWFISADPGTANFVIASMERKFRQDIVGNSYAAILLIGMLVTAGYALLLCFLGKPSEMGLVFRWLVLMLLILGIAISWQLAEADGVIQGSRTIRSLLDKPLPLLIFIAIVAGFIYSFRVLFGQSEDRHLSWYRWASLYFLVVGFIAAGYLASIEISGAEAVCGAVGDCNAVQQSQYASLFGIFSIAGLGLFCNALILAGWIMAYFGPLKYRNRSLLMLWYLLLSAVVFFIYLTFLEPFVIGATCFWCLTAAVTTNIQLMITTGSVIQSKTH